MRPQVKQQRVSRVAALTLLGSVGLWQLLSLGSVAGTSAVMTAGCGGGIECGNGVQEDGEECDDGNADQTDFCRSCVVYSPPRTTVTWDFNKYPARGFSGDSCNDTGVATVQVDIAGATSQSVTTECSKRQVVFFDLVPGPYTVSVTPLDINGVSKLTAPVSVPVMALATNIQVDVNVPFESWSQAYTGLFLFRLTWGMQTCAQAVPPVATQTLTLLVRGQPVATLTDSMQKVDGTDDKPCRALAEERPQSVADLPFGPATLEVVGKDSVGVEKFRKSFDTFVGIGQVNPTVQFDVPAPPPVDAPLVDAL